MTPQLRWIGFFATLLIVLMMGFNIVREPDRQEESRESFKAASVNCALTLYELHCATCHGAAGRGDENNPVLNAEFVQRKDFMMLYHTIERGRYNTEMAAFGINEGGVLTRAQIEALVFLIQDGNWERIEQFVLANNTPTPSAAELSGLPMVDVLPTPTSQTADMRNSLPMVDVEPTATPATNAHGLPMVGVQPTPGGNAGIGNPGTDLFILHCSECHGEQAQGTDNAPTLVGASFQEKSDEERWRIVSFGVEGTEMEGFAGVLTQDERRIILAYVESLNAVE